jgi:sulfoxide reductase catalytic subunit YedY
MIIRNRPSLRYSEVTPKSVYLNRRRFLSTAAGLLVPAGGAIAGMKLNVASKSPFSTGEKLTPFKDVTTYNNFYEFGTQKDMPAQQAHKMKTSPWKIKVDGHVNKPREFDLDAIMKLAPLEERIYRLRCVEAWSMVIPWIGYPLNALLNQVEPKSSAKYVAFESFYSSVIMLPEAFAGIAFPYVEGLRIDEAMNPLTLLCTGLYGETLPNQNGAPVRIVVPWKYGFKSIKSIVRIKLTDKQPATTWNMANSREYGFYSNVNPQVDHPRWSQGKERRIGEFFKRDTLMYNGYGQYVASMYSGMDLRKYY